MITVPPGAEMIFAIRSAARSTSGNQSLHAVIDLVCHCSKNSPRSSFAFAGTQPSECEIRCTHCSSAGNSFRYSSRLSAIGSAMQTLYHGVAGAGAGAGGSGSGGGGDGTRRFRGGSGGGGSSTSTVWPSPPSKIASATIAPSPSPAPPPTIAHVGGESKSVASSQLVSPIPPLVRPIVTAGCFTANSQPSSEAHIASAINFTSRFVSRLQLHDRCMTLTLSLPRFDTARSGLP